MLNVVGQVAALLKAEPRRWRGELHIGLSVANEEKVGMYPQERMI